MKTRLWVLVVAMVGCVMFSGRLSHADDLVINSFSGDGTITWTYPTNAVKEFRVEWAGTLNPATWTNDVPGIVPTGITMSIVMPMPVGLRFYRMSAVTNIALSPPDSMAVIPAGLNTGTDPNNGAYSLTNASSFYMDKYEVTKTLWDEVYNWAIANDYSFTNAGSGKASTHPVQMVNWYDCVKWCNARSEKEGRPVSYRVGGSVYRTGEDNAVTCDLSVAGYRLPTEVEWHYAARGGVSSNRFPWGNTIDHNKANYAGLPTSYDYDLGYAGCDTRYAKIPFPFTSPAGSFEDGKNGYGLYDMAGNVWEWCWDWDPGYEGRFRVARGGSWDFYAQESRVAFRGIRYPNYANYGVGFRAILPTGQ